MARSVRRGAHRAALATALLVAVVGPGLQPAEAQASSGGVTGKVTASVASVTETSCSETPGRTRAVTFRSDGHKRSAKASWNGTVTSDIDASDISRWTASAASTVKSSRTASTSSLAVTAAVRARITADLGLAGSSCRAAAEAAVVSTATVAVSRKGTLVLTAATTGGAMLVLDLESAGGNAHPVKVLGSLPAGFSAKIAVTPGKYQMTMRTTGTVDVDPDSAATGTVAGTAKATISVTSGKARATA